MSLELTLRPACPDDAEFVAPIIYDTMGFGTVMLGTDSKKDCLRRIQKIFHIPGHRLGYDGCQILHEGDTLVGYIMAFPHQEVLRRDRKFAHLVFRLNGFWRFMKLLILHWKIFHKKESKAGDFFISALGIAQYQRGKGYAKKLVQLSLEQAWSQSYAVIALVVDRENTEARTLYRKSGFVVDSTCNCEGHLISRMIIHNPNQGNQYANRRS